MTIQIRDNVAKAVILDISGIYVQIYDQGYFDSNSLKNIKKKYSNKKLWRVLVLD